MEGKISCSLTLEGWMDLQLKGIDIKHNELEVIATIKEGSPKVIRILSQTPLNEEQKRKWWEHIRDRFTASEASIEYRTNPEEYQEAKQLWVEEYERDKARYEDAVKK
ncbi:hypothetical protein HYW76_00585 [Candidatus Pacearchaeota archaeon]|nr:hypothetical protein [Candidatus Pacearchaeota archaeon]